MKTTGKITDIKATKGTIAGRSPRHYHDEDEIYYYYPVISFQTDSGEKLRFVSKRFSNEQEFYQIGDEVDVKYDAAKPNKAQHIDSMNDSNKFTMIGGVVVVVIIIAYFFFYYLR